MECPLVTAYLERLLPDLDASTLNQDLLDTARELRADPKNIDTHTPSRTAFCCEAALRFVHAAMLGEKKPDQLRTNTAPLDSAQVEDWRIALGPVLDYYGIEVAEARMALDARDVEQLHQRAHARQLKQVMRCFQLLEAAAQHRLSDVGSLFYSFFYTEKQSAENLVPMAQLLLTVPTP